jgi:hypothetical protein
MLTLFVDFLRRFCLEDNTIMICFRHQVEGRGGNR